MLRKRFLLLFIAAAVGIGLLWIEDYTTAQTQENIESASLLPDYYGEGLRNRSYTETGMLEREFIASHSIFQLVKFIESWANEVEQNTNKVVAKSDRMLTCFTPILL